MNLCITYTQLFLNMQERKNLEEKERKTKKGRRDISYEFPLLAEEMPPCYISQKITGCVLLSPCLDDGKLVWLDIHCRLLLQSLAICSSNIWLWWWTWGYAVSLSSICYSFVETDSFIFTRFPYTVLKTCRVIISMLTEMAYFVFLFCYLTCHFLWSTCVV